MCDDKAAGRLEQVGSRDHSITSEYRIFGPPGTGKTTNLSRQIRRAVERFGPEAVLVTSFSRAAAAELAGRDLPIDPDRIGTLHSHCYRALGGPQVAEVNVDEWNRRHPQLRITPVRKKDKLEGEEAGEENGQAHGGDIWLQELNRFRGLMIPPEAWPANVRDFAARWQQYKDDLGLLDFADLIETALRDIHIAPGNPAVIFVDEAQDLSRVQLALIRKWGRHAHYFILSGDEDQTIFSFHGASPEALLDPDIPDDHKIILKQSYRVPRAVHAIADRFIRQVTRRQEKPYLPRPAEGVFIRGPLTAFYKRPDYWLLKAADEHLARGHTVMFLASCAYMLEPVIAVLRKNAIPFHNPYRRSNGYWNPIRLGRKGSTANRILALLVAHPDFGEGHRSWTCGDVALWAEWLQSRGILRHDAKKRLQGASPTEAVTIGTLDEIFEDGALQSLLETFEGDYRSLLAWWQRRVTADVHQRVQYPVGVTMARGPKALLETPQAIVGTIHSVKGGEADVVFLFPDLSDSGFAAYRRHGAPRDAVIRTFYVGMTRARETLYLCAPESAFAVTF
ncbi:MAG: UvrD-helicase domain-containing protein [Halothiobacillaceae bacterium]